MQLTQYGIEMSTYTYFLEEGKMLQSSMINTSIDEWLSEHGNYDPSVRSAAKAMEEHIAKIDCKTHYHSNADKVSTSKKTEKRPRRRGIERIVAIAAQTEAVFLHHFVGILKDFSVCHEKGRNLRNRLLAHGLNLTMNGTIPKEVTEGYNELSRRIAQKKVTLT